MPSPIPRQDRWDCSLVLSHRPRPSLDSRRVGSCITRFGACTAFTSVTACKLAKSPKRPSTPEAPAASLPPLLLRLLPGGANQFPGGVYPTVDQRLFTAHENRELCKRLIVTADLSLFHTYGVVIQEGPSLCAGKLRADLERNFAGAHELTAEDLRGYASARSLEKANRAAMRKAPRRRPSRTEEQSP